jgi:hypothetical protein
VQALYWSRATGLRCMTAFGRPSANAVQTAKRYSVSSLDKMVSCCFAGRIPLHHVDLFSDGLPLPGGFVSFNRGNNVLVPGLATFRIDLRRPD